MKSLLLYDYFFIIKILPDVDIWCVCIGGSPMPIYTFSDSTVYAK